MYGNGRPLGTRKRMQLLIAIVLIAWATQTLLHQWGYGAEAASESQPAEKFVPDGCEGKPRTCGSANGAPSNRPADTKMGGADLLWNAAQTAPGCSICRCLIFSGSWHARCSKEPRVVL